MGLKTRIVDAINSLVHGNIAPIVIITALGIAFTGYVRNRARNRKYKERERKHLYAERHRQVEIKNPGIDGDQDRTQIKYTEVFKMDIYF